MEHITHHFACDCIQQKYTDLIDMASIALRELKRKKCNELVIKGLQKELKISKEVA